MAVRPIIGQHFLSVTVTLHSPHIVPYQLRSRARELKENHFPFLLAVSIRNLIHMLQAKLLLRYWHQFFYLHESLETV